MCKVETRTAFTFAFFLRNWQEIKRKLKHPWAGFLQSSVLSDRMCLALEGVFSQLGTGGGSQRLGTELSTVPHQIKGFISSFLDVLC